MGDVLRVLITTELFLPLQCGVTTAILSEMKALEPFGDDVRVLSIINDEQSHYDEERKCYYIKATLPQFYKDSYSSLNTKDPLVKDIIKWKPDIIHSQSEFFSFFFALHISKKLNIPIVHTCHTDFVSYSFHFTSHFYKTFDYWVSKVVPLLIKKARIIICSTDKIEALIKSYGVKQPIEKVFVGFDTLSFYRALDEREKSKLMEKWNIKSSDHILITVSRLSREKSIDDVIRLFKKAQERIDNLKLLIVGGGSILGALKEEAKRLKIEDKVIFTDEIERSSVWKYYKIGEIFVGSSLSETQGLTYLEAMASSLPLVVKDDSVLSSYLIPGYNGFSFKSDDEYVRIIEMLIRDKEKRKEVGIRAKETSEKFSLKIFGEKLHNIFERVIKDEENGR